MDISETAVAVLRAMRGRLIGRLDSAHAFLIDPGWSGPVPHLVATELHNAGLIEIDESVLINGTYAFRISEAGIASLESNDCG